MYKIVGADQKEYGPVPAGTVREWISERRANGSTLVRFEEGPWKSLSTFPEFAADLATAGSAGLPGAPPPLRGAAAPGSTFSSTPETNPLAIAGLVLSCAGALCTCCVPLFSTAGIVCSILALSQIRAQPTRWTGRNYAVAGLVIGIVGFVFLGLGVLFRSLGSAPRMLRGFNL